MKRLLEAIAVLFLVVWALLYFIFIGPYNKWTTGRWWL